MENNYEVCPFFSFLFFSFFFINNVKRAYLASEIVDKPVNGELELILEIRNE